MYSRDFSCTKLDQEHVQQLMYFAEESEPVNTCLDYITGVVLVRGIGLFRGDAPQEQLPPETMMALSLFAKSVIRQIACFGFVIYEIFGPFSAQVVDLRTVTVTVINDAHKPTRYAVLSLYVHFYIHLYI